MDYCKVLPLRFALFPHSARAHLDHSCWSPLARFHSLPVPLHIPNLLKATAPCKQVNSLPNTSDHTRPPFPCTPIFTPNPVGIEIRRGERSVISHAKSPLCFVLWLIIYPQIYIYIYVKITAQPFPAQQSGKLFWRCNQSPALVHQCTWQRSYFQALLIAPVVVTTKTWLVCFVCLFLCVFEQVIFLLFSQAESLFQLITKCWLLVSPASK